jgi:hypothetical protein
MRVVLQLVVLAGAVLTCVAQTDKAKTTTKYVDCVVPKAIASCTENKCIEDGGCARCALLQVTLPPDAEVVAVRYFVSSDDPKDGALHIISPKNVPDGGMPAVTKRSSQDHVMVMTTFYNRSAVSDRKAAIEVDYKQKSLEPPAAP